MTMVQIIICVMAIIVCGSGLCWLFYDIVETMKRFEAAEAERCESKDDEVE